MDSIRLRHDADRGRYEAHLGETCAAVLYYDDDTDSGNRVRDMGSTVVAPEHSGEGIGSALVRFALEDTRAGGMPIRATCWFVRGWIERHPEFADLLIDGPAAGGIGPDRQDAASNSEGST